MNIEATSFLNQIAIELNSDITINEDHAWLIPAQLPNHLLTITWLKNRENEQYEFTFSLALGEYSENIPSELILNLLTTNISMAILHGPKLSYSPKSNLLTLMDSFSSVAGNEVHIGEIAANFVLLGKEMHEQIAKQGTLLTINMEQ